MEFSKMHAEMLMWKWLIFCTSNDWQLKHFQHFIPYLLLICVPRTNKTSFSEYPLVQFLRMSIKLSIFPVFKLHVCRFLSLCRWLGVQMFFQFVRIFVSYMSIILTLSRCFPHGWANASFFSPKAQFSPTYIYNYDDFFT